MSRHRAELTKGILMPSMVIVEVAACCDGEMTASHLTRLRTRLSKILEDRNLGLANGDIVRNIICMGRDRH